jgi:hypothetical protein
VSIQSISVCPGMAWDPDAEWTQPAQSAGMPDGQVLAPTEAAEGDPSRARRPAGMARLRRRAHTDRGTFQSDDPATPDVDEAFEEAPKARPETEAQPGKLEQ